MYGVGGERELTEQILEHLHGYEGAWPVRVGNAAYNQKQHDVWGAMLDSVYRHATRDGLDEWLWPILARQVEAALENWREPDRGIWEVRGEPQHFVSSKVMCWVAAFTHPALINAVMHLIDAERRAVEAVEPLTPSEATLPEP